MFRSFFNQHNINGKKLYEKSIGLYKKHIRLRRCKKYFEIYIKHNLWSHFTIIHSYRFYFFNK